MQQVNGVHAHEPATPAPPGVTSDGPAAAPANLPADIVRRLKEPLPPEAVSPNPDKPWLSSIKVIYIVERLNDVFGLGGWRIDNEIVESAEMVVVKATLTAPAFGIVVEQFGGYNNPDRGDAFKGACTDALSKCASYLGVGMDVYKGLYGKPAKEERVTSDKKESSSSPANERPQSETQSAAVTGLTSKNLVNRFFEMKKALGDEWVGEVLSRYGYGNASQIGTLDRAREIYAVLLNEFRRRYKDAIVAVGREEYRRILSEFRIDPQTKQLSVEQSIRVYRFMEETIHART